MLEAIPLTGIRLVGALLLGAILVYWTIERLLGEGDDPTIRSSTSSDTGSASFLVSGTMAVATVASVAVALLLSPMGGGPVVSDPVPVLAAAAFVVGAHWIVEKEERE
ncbi:MULTISPECIES: hypothetical protein [Haloarcula]|uniref:hypothetical protein n=1 Tax=Haloarcula TaxID=2237 RepID=UPI0023E88968|nr:hypothetical protein [Halomicroarcula sp. SHR3]